MSGAAGMGWRHAALGLEFCLYLLMFPFRVGNFSIEKKCVCVCVCVCSFERH